MKIIINEKQLTCLTENVKQTMFLQKKIDEILKHLKQRYKDEEINSENWYLSLFSRINKVILTDIKLKKEMLVYIDVYSDEFLDEDDIQNFAGYLKYKFSDYGFPVWFIPNKIIEESLNPHFE
jgi:hypothetical protein